MSYISLPCSIAKDCNRPMTLGLDSRVFDLGYCSHPSRASREVLGTNMALANATQGCLGREARAEDTDIVARAYSPLSSEVETVIRALACSRSASVLHVPVWQDPKRHSCALMSTFCGEVSSFERRLKCGRNGLHGGNNGHNQRLFGP